MRRTDSHRIGSNAEESRMTKAYLTGEAHQQIQPHDCECEDENEGRDAQMK